jgi:hypothetical protein
VLLGALAARVDQQRRLVLLFPWLLGALLLVGERELVGLAAEMLGFAGELLVALAVAVDA